MTEVIGPTRRGIGLSPFERDQKFVAAQMRELLLARVDAGFRRLRRLD